MLAAGTRHAQDVSGAVRNGHRRRRFIPHLLFEFRRVDIRPTAFAQQPDHVRLNLVIRPAVPAMDDRHAFSVTPVKLAQSRGSLQSQNPRNDITLHLSDIDYRYR